MDSNSAHIYEPARHTLAPPWPAPRRGSGRGLGRFDRVVLAPGVETADQRRRIEAFFVEVERRTGARCFVWSGAIGDDRSVMIGLPCCPIGNLARRHTDTARDDVVVAPDGGSGSHVEDDRRIRTCQAGGQLFRGHPRYAGGITAEQTADRLLPFLR